MEATRKFFEMKTYEGIPTPSMKQQNKDNFGQNVEDKLVEWEKNQIKDLFKKFDADKKGVTKENLVEILKSLMKDECIIGKVPNLQPEEVSLFYFFTFTIFTINSLFRLKLCLNLGTSLKRKSALGGTSVLGSTTGSGSSKSERSLKRWSLISLL